VSDDESSLLQSRVPVEHHDVAVVGLSELRLERAERGEAAEFRLVSAGVGVLDVGRKEG